jgi:hypothetical protein
MVDAKAIGGMRDPCVGVVVDERDRQPELLCARRKQRAIGQTDEVTRERLAR